MSSFEELGLREELLNILEEEDLSRPTALQEAVIPALRRGGNLVARVSSGAGKTLAFGLGVFDRIEPNEEGDEAEGSSLRVLVLTSTATEATRVALSLVPYAQAVDLQIAVPGSGWGVSIGDAAVLVAAVGDVMGSVRGSQIKLDALDAVVIDGASAIVELGEWEQVDAVLDLLPRDAQRIVLSSSMPPAVEDLVDRRVKRALRYPAEAAIHDQREVKEVRGTIGFVLASPREKLDLLASQLRQRERGSSVPVIFCRSEERAADLAEQLSIRGFLVGSPDDDDADVAIAASDTSRDELLAELEGERGLGQAISYDVPGDSTTLVRRHQGDPDSVILLEPRELAHLREVARQAAFQLRSAPIQVEIPGSAAALEEFRGRLRSAIREEDLTAQMLVLEPLFDEFTAAEVAAAAVALLRRRGDAATASNAPGAPSAPSARSTRAAPDQSAPSGPPPVTWARLFVSMGSRDEVRAGDLVGALAGEANIPGSKIGKIEIRESFSIVEVQAEVAEQVIRSVNGTTVKGRSVRVDFDRGGPERRPPTRGAGGPPRRTVRRPPGEGR